MRGSRRRRKWSTRSVVATRRSRHVSEAFAWIRKPVTCPSRPIIFWRVFRGMSSRRFQTSFRSRKSPRRETARRRSGGGRRPSCRGHGQDPAEHDGLLVALLQGPAVEHADSPEKNAAGNPAVDQHAHQVLSSNPTVSTSDGATSATPSICRKRSPSCHPGCSRAGWSCPRGRRPGRSPWNS